MSIEKLSANASLKQVMDKFEEISIQDFSSLNVVTATELPPTGKEGQLCIITDTEPNMIYFDYVEPNLSEGDIFIQHKLDDFYKDFNISSKNANVRIKIQNIYQIKSGNKTILEGYIYIDSKWEYVGVTQTYIFEEGIGVNTPVVGGFEKYTTETAFTLDKNKIRASYSLGAYQAKTTGISSINTIDVTGYSKLMFEAYSTSTKNTAINARFGVSSGVSNSTFVASTTFFLTSPSTSSSSLSRQMVEVDISNVFGPMHINIIATGDNKGNGAATANLEIYNIILD